MMTWWVTKSYKSYDRAARPEVQPRFKPLHPTQPPDRQKRHFELRWGMGANSRDFTLPILSVPILTPPLCAAESFWCGNFAKRSATAALDTRKYEVVAAAPGVAHNAKRGAGTRGGRDGPRPLEIPTRERCGLGGGATMGSTSRVGCFWEKKRLQSAQVCTCHALAWVRFLPGSILSIFGRFELDFGWVGGLPPPGGLGKNPPGGF